MLLKLGPVREVCAVMGLAGLALYALGYGLLYAQQFELALATGVVGVALILLYLLKGQS